MIWFWDLSWGLTIKPLKAHNLGDKGVFLALFSRNFHELNEFKFSQVCFFVHNYVEIHQVIRLVFETITNSVQCLWRYDTGFQDKNISFKILFESLLISKKSIRKGSGKSLHSWFWLLQPNKSCLFGNCFLVTHMADLAKIFTRTDKWLITQNVKTVWDYFVSSTGTNPV